MTQDIVRHIEDSIQRDKSIVELGKAVERLQLNRDFKAVIVEGYLKQEAIRLVHLRVDPSMQTPERQASIMNQIDAIGGFSQYLRTIEYNAAMAEKAIETNEAMRSEIQAEELSRGWS